MKYIEDKMYFYKHAFSREAADRLNKFKVKAFKIGSGNATIILS